VRQGAGKKVLFSQVHNTAIQNAETTASLRYGKLVVLLLGLAALLRGVAVLLIADVNPATANVWEYGDMAITALKHGALVSEAVGPDGSITLYPTAFMPPLPMFLWMGLFATFGVSKAALAAFLLINIVCGVAIVYLTVRIARALFDSSLIALLAGLMAAGHPVFVYSAATYHAVNVYLLLLLALFHLSLIARSAPLRTAVLSGVLLGAAILARTEYLALGFAVIFGALLAHRKLAHTALTLIVAAALVAPWTIRNYATLDRFIPVANASGYALFKGFNPRANGSGDWVDNNGVAQELLGSRLAEVPVTKAYESDTDAVYRSAAQDFMRSEPFRAFVVLPARKILLFWFFDIYDPTTYHIVYQLALWPTVLLSALGLLHALRAGLLWRPEHRTVLLVFAAQTVVMVAYAVHARYRMNVEPFLFAYASYGAVMLLGRVRPREIASASAASY
jgi:hypothetical protein